MCDKWELNSYPTLFVVFYIIFGIFMFPFYKKIKEYRKQYKYSCDVRMYEWNKMAYNLKYGDDDYQKYLNKKRYLKLKKIKSKISIFF